MGFYSVNDKHSLHSHLPLSHLFLLLLFIHLQKILNTAGSGLGRRGRLLKAVGSVVGNSEGKGPFVVGGGGSVCVCLWMYVDAFLLPLGLFEALAWGSQEWALGWCQGAVGFRHQMRMGRYHGLPTCCLHHLRSMAGGQDANRKQRTSISRKRSHKSFLGVQVTSYDESAWNLTKKCNNEAKKCRTITEKYCD